MVKNKNKINMKENQIMNSHSLRTTKLFTTHCSLLIILFIAHFSLLIVSCENPFMEVLLEPFDKPLYTVTVNGGEGSGEYFEGETIAIAANIPAGQIFTGWKVDSGDAALENADNEATAFIMPPNDVAVTAKLILIALTHISANYLQPGIIYTSTPLDSLKNNLTVTAYYNNGEVKTLDNTDYSLSGTLTAPSSGITVSFGGQTDTFTVTVSPVTLTHISANYSQSGTIYTSTPLDNLKNNLTVTAYYEDGSTLILNDAAYTLSGTLAAPSSVITVNFGGQTDTFDVDVSSVILTHISANYFGTGVLWPITPADDLKNNLTVTAYFNDGSSEVLNNADYSLSPAALIVGLNTITVSYSGQTTDFTVTVDPTPVHTVSINVNTDDGGTGGTVIGAGSYEYTSTVTITATANAGYAFTGWTVVSGGITLADDSLLSVTFTMPNNDVTITANFEAAPIVTITTHPTGGSITTVSSRNLTVAATSAPTGGTLSYQWYRNTTNSNTGGTIISGATNSSYTASGSALGTGTYYFYCIVTYTYSGITVTATSNTATVTVTLPALTGSIDDYQPMTSGGGVVGVFSLTTSGFPVPDNQLTYTWTNASTGAVIGTVRVPNSFGIGMTVPFGSVRLTITHPNYSGSVSRTFAY